MGPVKCPRCQSLCAAGAKICTRCGTSLSTGGSPQSVNPAPQIFTFRRGQLVANRYSILDVIGRGGMGCIYRAHDNVLKEEVALKTLLPQFARDKLVVERFYNEARIARGLSHPNIVRVHDIGAAGENLYISMELVKGKSLRTMLDSLPTGSRLPIRTTLRILDELCEALKYAHQYTVHRDIKPENIMCTADGHIKLMDFGISKLMASTNLTAASVVMGTPHYMSPEQFKDSSRVDARADVYSIGVVLYEILTGNIPTGVPRPASQVMRDIPPSLDPIVARCLEPNPDDRFQCAEDLQAALRPLRALVEAGTDLGSVVPRKREARDHGPMLRRGMGVALLLAVAVASAGVILRLNQRSLAASSGVSPRTTETSPGSSRATNVLEGFLPRIEQARALASAQAEQQPNWKPVLAFADERWKEALELAKGGDPAAAKAAAWNALRTYLGPVLQPSGMVFIPGGTVELTDGANRTRVHVAPFYIDAGETTLEEFRRFAQENQWQVPRSAAQTPGNYPVTGITYYDALAYASWAGKMLPSEAQWVRAATAAPLGDEKKDESASSESTAGGDAPATPDNYAILMPPGSRASDKTPLGVADMGGNAAEWTASLWQAVTAPPPSSPPTFGTVLVVRGGSFAQMTASPLQQRAAERYEQDRRLDLGFRCVWEVPDSLAQVDTLLKGR